MRRSAARLSSALNAGGVPQRPPDDAPLSCSCFAAAQSVSARCCVLAVRRRNLGAPAILCAAPPAAPRLPNKPGGGDQERAVWPDDAPQQQLLAGPLLPAGLHYTMPAPAAAAAHGNELQLLQAPASGAPGGRPRAAAAAAAAAVAAAGRRVAAAAAAEDDEYDVEEQDDGADPGLDESWSSGSGGASSSSKRKAPSKSRGLAAAAAAAAAASGGGGGGGRNAQRWTPEEHELLCQVVAQYAAQGQSRRWSDIARHVPGRSGKQCRERWINHRNPDSKRGPWDTAEELLLCKWHSILGSCWARITRKLEGRTENAVKNHWNAAMRAKHPSRNRTPLALYVGELKAGAEPADALLTMLQALEATHPALVADTAAAAVAVRSRQQLPQQQEQHYQQQHYQQQQMGSSPPIPPSSTPPAPRSNPAPALAAAAGMAMQLEELPGGGGNGFYTAAPAGQQALPYRQGGAALGAQHLQLRQLPPLPHGVAAAAAGAHSPPQFGQYGAVAAGGAVSPGRRLAAEVQQQQQLLALGGNRPASAPPELAAAAAAARGEAAEPAAKRPRTSGVAARDDDGAGSRRSSDDSSGSSGSGLCGGADARAEVSVLDGGGAGARAGKRALAAQLPLHTSQQQWLHSSSPGQPSSTSNHTPQLLGGPAGADLHGQGMLLAGEAQHPGLAPAGGYSVRVPQQQQQQQLSLVMPVGAAALGASEAATQDMAAALAWNCLQAILQAAGDVLADTEVVASGFAAAPAFWQPQQRGMAGAAVALAAAPPPSLPPQGGWPPALQAQRPLQLQQQQQQHYLPPASSDSFEALLSQAVMSPTATSAPPPALPLAPRGGRCVTTGLQLPLHRSCSERIPHVGGDWPDAPLLVKPDTADSSSPPLLLQRVSGTAAAAGCSGGVEPPATLAGSNYHLARSVSAPAFKHSGLAAAWAEAAQQAEQQQAVLPVGMEVDAQEQERQLLDMLLGSD